LTLADALSFAVLKEKPDEIIDIATLTGACMVALGEEIAGLWGNSDKLTERIEKSAERRGERVWRMPLPKDYKELIKSHIADLKNTQTGRFGGAITAALFLSEFVGHIPWAHLDIAGPSYVEKDTPLAPKGGAGFGVRTLLELLVGSES
jgi:leucyl aminopeptidase